MSNAIDNHLIWERLIWEENLYDRILMTFDDHVVAMSGRNDVKASSAIRARLRGIIRNDLDALGMQTDLPLMAVIYEDLQDSTDQIPDSLVQEVAEHLRDDVPDAESLPVRWDA